MILVVEWNNPNAQFELQFVGPQGLYYTWNNTTDLPHRNAMNGYLSDSFEIADLDNGPWLVNIKYHGNQEKKASYFKFSLRDQRNGSEWVQTLQLATENLKFRFLEINSNEVVSLIP
jgi:uncharacterized protein YfaP (DUF2135 family)